MAMSKAAIVETSIKILNRDGIEGLTMRTLANNLGVKAASLYWHIKGKQELYGEIAEYLCAQIPMPCDGAPKERLLESCKAYRSVLLKTRDSVAILEESMPNTPCRIAIIKEQFACLLNMGVNEQNLMTAGNLLNNYVLSFVADELRMKKLPQEALHLLLERFKPEMMQWITSERDFDEQFLYGLEVIFAGLKEVKQ